MRHCLIPNLEFKTTDDRALSSTQLSAADSSSSSSRRHDIEDSYLQPCPMISNCSLSTQNPSVSIITAAGSTTNLEPHTVSSSELNTDPRPYKCEICQVGFRVSGHLYKHYRSKAHLAAIVQKKSS